MRYYFNWRGKFVHGVRAIRHHHNGGTKYTHSSVIFICGNSGFISKDRPARIYKEPPKHKLLCKRCFPNLETSTKATQ